MAKVTFDGPNKLILVDTGITELDVKEDLYTAWKDWVAVADNAKFAQAISAIGGDPISGVVSLGSTFFLENGWRIRPYSGNHTLTVSGNLYTREGVSPFVSALGTYNVMVNMARSNLIDTVSTAGGSGLTTTQATQLETAANGSALARKLAGNKAVITPQDDGSKVIVVYDDDGTTPVHTMTISSDGNVRSVV